MLKKYNVDLLNGEVASNTVGTLYSHDIKKIVRETKNIADLVCHSRFVSGTKKLKTKAQSIQIAGSKGEAAEVKLVDDVLYVNNRLGSLRLPSGVYDLELTKH